MADHPLQKAVAERTVPTSLHRAMRFCAVCACSRPLLDFALNAAGTPSYECLGCVRLGIPDDLLRRRPGIGTDLVRLPVGTGDVFVRGALGQGQHLQELDDRYRCLLPRCH